MKMKQHRALWRLIPIALLVLAGLGFVATQAAKLRLLGTDEIVWFKSPRHNPPLCAVFLSGDMGFGHGMSGVVAEAVAHNGIPVLGINSPVAFARQRTFAQAQQIVENAIRLAMAKTGAPKVVLMGQSYGADIVATTAPHLPQDLRRKIAAIHLTVPARDVYFRADPTGFAYLWKPDAKPLADFRKIDWTPVACLYGVEETGSLCPALDPAKFHVIGVPGGHHLNHDHPRVVADTLAFLRSVIPGKVE